jgi:ankyrin repeat protein
MILLKSGADVNEQDSNGWTIFHHIAEKGFTEILKQIFHERE